MSTEIAKYKDKDFWIHNGIAELWFDVLSKIVLKDTQIEWLQAYKKNIDDMLECRYFTGLVQFDFDINSTEKEGTFRSLIIEVDYYLKQQMILSEDKKVLRLKIDQDQEEYRIRTDMLIPELQRLNDLFFNPAAITVSGQQCAGSEGWFDP